LDFATFKAYRGRGRDRFVDLREEKLDALGCQPGSLDTIEWRRAATLLDMPENCLSDIKEAVTLLFEESGHEGAVI